MWRAGFMATRKTRYNNALTDFAKNPKQHRTTIRTLIKYNPKDRNAHLIYLGKISGASKANGYTPLFFPASTLNSPGPSLQYFVAMSPAEQLLRPFFEAEFPHMNFPTSPYFPEVMVDDLFDSIGECGTSAYQHLLSGLLPEFIFTTLITAVLTFLALALGKNLNKFELADQCLRYTRYCIVVLLGGYLISLNIATKQPLFNGYVFTSASIL